MTVPPSRSDILRAHSSIAWKMPYGWGYNYLISVHLCYPVTIFNWSSSFYDTSIGLFLLRQCGYVVLLPCGLERFGGQQP